MGYVRVSPSYLFFYDQLYRNIYIMDADNIEVLRSLVESLRDEARRPDIPAGVSDTLFSMSNDLAEVIQRETCTFEGGPPSNAGECVEIFHGDDCTGGCDVSFVDVICRR